MTTSPRMILALYLTNSALLITHEVDSAYWHEWTLFHLPGGIQFFLLLNFLLVLLVLYGLQQISRSCSSAKGFSLMLAGFGLVTFTLHTSFILAGHPEFRTPTSIALLVLILLVSVAQIIAVRLCDFDSVNYKKGR